MHESSYARPRLKDRACNPGARSSCVQRCRKVRAGVCARRLVQSVCARRFVRACVQEGSYERVCKKVRTGLVLKKSRLISDFFNNPRTSIACAWGCPPTFESSWLQSWCALLVLAKVGEGSYEHVCKKVRTSVWARRSTGSVLKKSRLTSDFFNDHRTSIA